jgi:hypothetical protein
LPCVGSNLAEFAPFVALDAPKDKPTVPAVEPGSRGGLAAGTSRLPVDLIEAELVEAVVVDAEVMGQLVDNRPLDLDRQTRGIRKVGFER